MIHYFLISLAGFFWITRDIIRVPETFNDSWFKQFAGNQFIDPQVSWINQYKYGEILSFVISAFSDLFHVLGTAIILIFVTMFWKAYNKPDNLKSLWDTRIKSKTLRYLLIVFMMFMCFGLGGYTAQGIFRN